MHVADAADKSKLFLRLVLKLKASYTSSVRPHALAASGLIHQEFKAYTLVA